MKTGAFSAGDAEHGCSERFKSVPMPFDVLILGMGSDGHTASLFPGAAKLADAVDMDSGKKCISIVPCTALHERMTLTLPTILSSREIFLHITGQGKRDVYEQACFEGPPEEMPIRFVLRQEKVPVNTYWCA
jgi:6-phosphogluconolactonase